jgi:hypothetical protein
LPARDVPNASNRRQQKRPPEGGPIIHNVMLIPRRFGLPVYDRRPVRLRRSRKDRGPAGRRLAGGAEGAVHCPHLPVSSCRRRMRRSSATEVPATQHPTASRPRFARSHSLRRDPRQGWLAVGGSAHATSSVRGAPAGSAAPRLSRSISGWRSTTLRPGGR